MASAKVVKVHHSDTEDLPFPTASVETGTGEGTYSCLSVLTKLYNKLYWVNI